MNRLDVEMLNRSLGGLGDSFAQRRQQEFQQQQAMQRLALEQSMRGDQQQHYQNEEETNKRRESNEVGFHAQTLKNESDRNDIQGLQQKQAFFQSVAGLNATGQLPDEARDDFNDWLKNDDHFGATGLQIQKPDPQFQKNGNKEAAIVNATKTALSYHQQATESDDPDEKKQLEDYATKLDSWIEKQGKFAPPKPGSVTDENIELDKDGHATRKTKTVTPLTPPAPIAPSAPDAAQQPVSFAPPQPDAGAFSPQPQVSPEAIQSLLSTPASPTAAGSPSAAPIATPTAPINPPPSHVAFLKANANNPKVVQDFEQKYGQGSATQYLQGP